MWNLFKSPVTISERLIDIGLLSEIWKGVSEPVSQCSQEKETPIGIENTWENRENSQFWEQYILPYHGDIGQVHLEVIREILKDLELYGNCPSIVINDNETSADYQVLTDVSLLEHTLNVCRKARDILKTSEADYQVSMAKVMIAALGHDMGKIPEIAQPDWQMINSHTFKSCEWLKKKINHLRNKDNILEAVKLHHAGERELNPYMGNKILSILRQADYAARESELKTYRLHYRSSNEDIIQKVFDTKSLDAFSDNQSTEVEKSGLPDETRNDNQVTEDMFLKALAPEISNNEFDAFRFNNCAYFSVNVLQKVLNNQRQSLDQPPFYKAEDVRTFIDSRFTKMKKGRFRLRFKDKPRPFKPIKLYLYVTDAIPSDAMETKEADIPHDSKGRWLKSLKPINNKTETV
ncbi:HD domain-containing protein [Desulfonema limicola]|uniref:HD domain-containing protein n=1 Tax=Desulfonema limicola TaxID=45656 RepID=A0A975B494_9BACT|nr:HD domain-containing protein [Desulfonema limicola]QTA78520.1 HD domain-containing protein [Desulfonema limicola]